MKIYVRHVGNNPTEWETYTWHCINCGVTFKLHDALDGYLAPNYCPKCGCVRRKSTSKEKEEEE